MTADTVITPVVRLIGVSKSYRRAGVSVRAVTGVTLDLFPGTLALLTGPSGSGKSTLLAVISGYDSPDSGELQLSPEIDPATWSAVAFVPQALGLMPDLTLGENVALALRLSRLPRRTASDLLEVLEVSHLQRRYPRQASLGEQQRVALVRALCAQPKLLVLDEPTAHQDSRRAHAIRQALSLAVEHGACVLVASHDSAFTDVADTSHTMADGVLHSVARDPS